MAYAQFSPENRMQEFLRAENTTTLFVSTLASVRGVRGLSQSRLSAVVRGRALEHDAAKALGALITKLEHLRNTVDPIPVRFHNAADINDLLNMIESGQLLVVASRSETNSSEEATTILSDNIADGEDQLNPLPEFSNDRREVD